MTLAEITTGYYIGARGNHSVRDSLIKLLKLPALHAIWLALLWNAADMTLPAIAVEWWEKFTGAWVIIGMMLIGVALGKVETFRVDFKLIGWLSVVKFILWPAAAIGLVMFDIAFLGLLDRPAQIILIVMGTVPLAGNTVAYATQLDILPGEAATAILASTLLALVYIPAIFWLVALWGISP